MADNRGDEMTIQLVSDEKIAETSSKGNQEKWYDRESGLWYKLDQFGYEALAETTVSTLLEQSNMTHRLPLYAIGWSGCRFMAGSAQVVPARIFCGPDRRLSRSIDY